MEQQETQRQQLNISLSDKDIIDGLYKKAEQLGRQPTTGKDNFNQTNSNDSKIEQTTLNNLAKKYEINYNNIIREINDSLDKDMSKVILSKHSFLNLAIIFKQTTALQEVVKYVWEKFNTESNESKDLYKKWLIAILKNILAYRLSDIIATILNFNNDSEKTNFLKIINELDDQNHKNLLKRMIKKTKCDVLDAHMQTILKQYKDSAVTAIKKNDITQLKNIIRSMFEQDTDTEKNNCILLFSWLLKEIVKEIKIKEVLNQITINNVLEKEGNKREVKEIKLEETFKLFKQALMEIKNCSSANNRSILNKCLQQNIPVSDMPISRNYCKKELFLHYSANILLITAYVGYMHSEAIENIREYVADPNDKIPWIPLDFLLSQEELVFDLSQKDELTNFLRTINCLQASLIPPLVHSPSGKNIIEYEMQTKMLQKVKQGTDEKLQAKIEKNYIFQRKPIFPVYVPLVKVGNMRYIEMKLHEKIPFYPFSAYPKDPKTTTLEKFIQWAIDMFQSYCGTGTHKRVTFGNHQLFTGNSITGAIKKPSEKTLQDLEYIFESMRKCKHAYHLRKVITHYKKVLASDLPEGEKLIFDFIEYYAQLFENKKSIDTLQRTKLLLEYKSDSSCWDKELSLYQPETCSLTKASSIEQKKKEPAKQKKEKNESTKYSRGRWNPLSFGSLKKASVDNATTMGTSSGRSTSISTSTIGTSSEGSSSGRTTSISTSTMGTSSEGTGSGRTTTTMSSTENLTQERNNTPKETSTNTDNQPSHPLMQGVKGDYTLPKFRSNK